MIKLSPRISMIVACAQNMAIGKDNDLIWHISEDLKHFKRTTMDHTVIMGRRTWDSLPKKPLPGRHNIVLTHDNNFQTMENVSVARSINDVFNLLEPNEEAFVMGGATLYQAFMPFASRLFITWVHKDFEADVYFPNIDLSVFNLVEETPVVEDEKSGLSYHFAEYLRKPDHPVLGQ